MEYEQNRSLNIRDEQSLPKPPKALDGKMYILVLQTVMCVIILSVSIIIKTFFTDLYKDTRLFYKENFEDSTTASEVLNKNDIGATVSVITSSEITANANMDSNPSYNSTSSNNTTSSQSTSSNLGVGGPILENEIVFNEIRENVTTNRFLAPINNYTVTSRFGERTDPISHTESSHNGIDLAAEFGEEIFASLGGEIEFAGYDSSYGNYVKIKHSNSFKTVYAHCSKLNVKTGDSVKAGQVIALVGSTGRSTGPHLHFEVLCNDIKVNPENYVVLK